MSIIDAFWRHYQSVDWVKRVSLGVTANLYGQAFILITQLISIPLLTIHWGVVGYGIWLILATVPSYLAMSDLGLGMAARVEISRNASKGNTEEGLRVFQSVWLLITGIVVAIVSAGLLCATLVYLAAPVTNQPFDTRQIALAAIMALIYSFAIVQMSSIYVVYQSTRRFALGTFLLMSMFPAEGIWLVGSVLLGGDMVVVLAGYAVIRWIGVAISVCVLRYKEPWFRLGVKHADLQTIKRLAPPSAAVFLLNAGQMLMLQGVVAALGFAGGPAVVALFGATRFLCRIPLQFHALIAQATLPELTHAFIEDASDRVHNLIKINLITGMAITLPFLILYLIAGNLVIAMLAQGVVGSRTLFLVLGLVTLFYVTWSTLASPLLAMNEASRYAHYYFGLAALTCATPFIAHRLGFNSTFGPSIAVASAQLVSEIAMLMLLIRIRPFRRRGRVRIEGQNGL